MNLPVNLRVLSLGAGVQSTAMYLMAVDGEFADRPDVAIFADTGVEPPWVYENLWRLSQAGSSVVPIHIVSAGCLGDSLRRSVGDSEGRFASVPFWVESEAEPGRAAPGRRQCTREYKIDVVKREIRRMLGLKPRQHAAGRFHVEEWLGISLDEVQRAKPSRYRWITTRWPLIFDRPMHRYELVRWLNRRGWPPVRKSACVFCPFRSNGEWIRWRDEVPDLFEIACQWDELLRSRGPIRGMRKLQYVSNQLVPLRDITADPATDQLDLFGNECEGMCGL